MKESGTCQVNSALYDAFPQHLMYLVTSTLCMAFISWGMRWYFRRRSSHFCNCSVTTQLYACKNIMKSGVLFMLIPYSFIIIWQAFVNSVWERDYITICGTLYASTDMCGVFLLRNKLHRSTKIHHFCVFLFQICILILDHRKCPWIQPLVFYGASCSFTFLVNFYLGYRFLLNKSDMDTYWY